MELLQLQYFCELAQSQHLRRTAEKLMISAPALSHTIKKLEQEIGVPLFDRVGRRIVLNQYGECYYHSVKRALMDLERGRNAALELYSKYDTLTVAITNPLLWCDLLDSYQAAAPDIHIDIKIINEIGMWKNPDLQFDFYLGNAADMSEKDLNRIMLYPEEKPVILVNKNHPFAKKEFIDLRECEHETFFSFKGFHFSACKWQELMFQTAGLTNIKIEQGDFLTRIKRLRNNSCISLTTELGMKADMINDLEIAAIPVIYPYIPRRQAISWSSHLSLTPAGQNFLNFAVDYCQSNSHTAS